MIIKKIEKNIEYYSNRTLIFFRHILYDFYRPRLKKPVFIVGCSRSGTTAVYKTLSASRHLSSLSKESHGMWEKIHPASEKNWDSHELTEKDIKVSDTDRVTRFYYSHLGLKRMVDKANQNCFRIPYLLKLFPDAVFVWVKRNGPDNINSLIHGWHRPEEYGTWSKELPANLNIEKGKFSRWCFFLFKGWRNYTAAGIEEVCARQWMEANQAVMRSRELIPDSQWIEVAYENILKNAVEAFKPVFEQLKLPFDDSMTEFCETLVQRPYNAFSQPRMNKWKEENPVRIQRILPEIEPVMKKMGYHG